MIDNRWYLRYFELTRSHVHLSNTHIIYSSIDKTLLKKKEINYRDPAQFAVLVTRVVFTFIHSRMQIGINAMR